MAHDSQSQRYQLTINNPDEHGYDHQKIFEICRDNFKTLEYLCMADEKGSTFHTHIFVCFSSRVRFSTIKKQFPEAHIEKAKGTVSDNVNYIKKSGKWKEDVKHGTKMEGTFQEFGKRPPDSRGKREEMTELYEMVGNGMTNAEILAVNQDYIPMLDTIDKLRTTLLQDRYKTVNRIDIEVIYISGKTGTGKTRGVLEEHGVENVYRVTDYAHPFDGYKCQPVIVFDEFRISLHLKDMLNYCDIYPIELPARYANKFACYKTVYIISNWPLGRQYVYEQQNDIESWDAFLRRIHKVRIYWKDVIHEYSSVQDYLNRFQNNSSFVEIANPFWTGKTDTEGGNTDNTGDSNTDNSQTVEDTGDDNPFEQLSFDDVE